jgi:hypothetical protein
MKVFMRIGIRHVVALTLVAFLVACGGGGGGGPGASTPAVAPVASTATFQLRTAFVNYFNDSRSLPFTVAGISSGIPITGSGTLVQGTPTSTTFGTTAALQKSSTGTGSITGNGVTVPVNSISTTYVDSNYLLLGHFANEYWVANPPAALPSTGLVSDTAVWSTENRYTTSAMTTRLGDAVTSYAILPDTATTALLKLTVTERDTVGTVTTTSAITFRMTPSGALTRISESAVSGATVVTLTY